MKHTISGPGRIRQLNRTAVLAHIRLHGKDSRLQIGKELGLSASAMTSVVNELINEELLINSDLIKNNGSKIQGRPISNLELNPNKACVFGIVLRPSANICIIESAWCDYSGAVHPLSHSLKIEVKNYQSIIDGISKSIAEIKKQLPLQSHIYGLSIGIPGVVENQTIPIAPKLPCIENPKFIDTLTKLFDFPVSFENDVNLGAMSELQSQTRLRDISFAYLHIYSGVGSSIVLEGKLLKGRRGWAGEIGQLQIPNVEKKYTSFEQILGVDGILGDLLETLDLPRSNVELLNKYIDSDNSEKISDDTSLIIESTVKKYCNELFNVINILHSVVDLDEVIIDFESTHLLNKLLPRIKERINTLKHPLAISLPSIEHQADLYGAALNALNLAIDNIEKREIKTKKIVL